ncbi:MAG: hypothetical protein NUV56_04350 [Candidatus Uhrbacteria bacterium]|nr:hypothetical protein [Candidatus Uhrbacteria bacterium]
MPAKAPKHSLLDPVSRCPFCGAAYEEGRIRVLEHQGPKEVFHATCGACQRAMLFSLERKQESVSCVGMFTDCDAEDCLRFRTAKRITLDDVLAAHVLLRK